MTMSTLGNLFPMCAFELVSAVPEDAADDKKQENHFLIFFLMNAPFPSKVIFHEWKGEK